MVFPRASAQLPSRVFRQSTQLARSTNRTRSWQRIHRRGYASEGEHGSHQKSAFSGELPWIIGSTIVTVPSVYYLIQPQIERYSGKKGSHGGHGEHGHGDGEGGDEEQEHGEESDSGEEESPTKGEDAEGNAESNKESDENGGEGDTGEESEQKSESDEGDGAGANKSGPDTPSDKGSKDTAHETDSGQNIEGVQFKGATSGGTKEGEQGDTRKHIPDAKGGSKKRIESDYGGKEGEATKPEQDPSNGDMGGATSKPAGSMNTQSGKQEGLSNTDTKHSTDIAADPEKSTKASGAPDTAKDKGTVDPRGPAR